MVSMDGKQTGLDAWEMCSVIGGFVDCFIARVTRMIRYRYEGIDMSRR